MNAKARATHGTTSGARMAAASGAPRLMDSAVCIEPHMEGRHCNQSLRGDELAAIEIRKTLGDEILFQNAVFRDLRWRQPLAATRLQAGLVALFHRHMESEFGPSGIYT